MNQRSSALLSVDQINGAAVGDVNAQCDTALIGDNAVAAGEFPISFHDCVDACDFITVNLLGGEQRPIADSNCVANFEMGRFQSLQCFRFIMRNMDARNSSRENVATHCEHIQRRKLLERKLHYGTSNPK